MIFSISKTQILALWVVCSNLLIHQAFATVPVIGTPSWPSARVTAHIISQLLERELGIRAELRDRSTLGILAGINTGELHIHPEIWLPNLKKRVDYLVNKEGTLKLSGLSSVANQNICVTKDTVKLTGIKNVSDLSDPNMAVKFDTNSDGFGEIWIGAQNWSSTNIERIRAKSYAYDKTMSLLVMEEDVAMAAVDVAVALGKPYVFYCYSPHHVFELHDIQILEEPTHDSGAWKVVTAAKDPNWLENSEAGSAWASSSFRIGYSTFISKKMPNVAIFLDRVNFNPAHSMWMSYQVQVEGVSPADAARTWIENNKNIVMRWLGKAN